MLTRGLTLLSAHLPTGRGITTATVAAALVALPACSSVSGDPGNDSDASPAAQETPEPVSFSVKPGHRDKNVTVDTRVRVNSNGGEIDKVRVTYQHKGERKRLSGSVGDGSTKWVADDLLEPGKSYRVAVKGHNTDGEKRKSRFRFTTEDLVLDEQAYPSVAPLDGETVGIGMPVVVRFDIPVTRKKAVERHLSVNSTPNVKGTWSWMSDTEVHYRPKKYWPAGTDIKVNVDVNGVRTAKGIYGQESRSVNFQVTDKAVKSVMDVDDQTLKVKVDGKVARKMPATSGKEGFETRNGTKLIMQKFREKRMDAATTGIDEDDPEYYNISDVEYAMRVTTSGEFIHAAPWSVGSQGSTNVSHGCVGMNTSDAKWFYNLSHRGDPVTFVDSSRGLEPGNGWTDWNVSYQKFKKGSALN